MTGDGTSAPHADPLMATPTGPGWPVRLHTRVLNPHGTAGRVLLLHGLGSDGDVWWWLGSQLADRGCLVVAPDLRSHGASPTAVDHRIVTLARDVAVLGSGWDLIVGHSLGGAIAAHLLADPALGAGGGVLLDPVLHLDATRRDVARTIYPAEAGVLDPAAVAAANPRWSPRDVERKVVAAAAVTPEVITAVLDHNDPWDVRELVDRWTVPVDVLAADPAQGALLTAATIAQLPAAVRDRAQVVPGVGHGIQREAHALVLATVLRHLQESP